ncbi:MAG TPA: amidohydrolase family protein [Kofleriaceae bacterium]|nr:amidohydrolase family protein [Kofleriaceae bacterium]
MGNDQPRVVRYAFVTVGRHSGEVELRIDADRTRHEHYTFNDRGRGPDVTATWTVDANDAPRHLRVSGVDYLKAPVDETLDEAGDEVHWHGAGEDGHGTGFYSQRYEALNQDLVAALLRAPDHHVKLLPSGTASIESDRVVEVQVGGTARKLRQLAIAGFGFTPFLIWLDESNDVFASASSWISLVRDGGESAIPKLVELDNRWLADRAAHLASSLAHHPPAAGLAITHASVFDPETKTVAREQTVVIVGDRITAVGGTAAVPAGAQVIDAHGRMVLPGLTDMHVHLGDVDGLLQLASGVTTVRDMGNTIDELAARVARYDALTEIGPRVLRAGLVDGPGKFAAPTGTLISTPDEARAAVDMLAKRGYVQIKIYSSIAPELVPVIAKAAHEHGLRVSGHIPNGMVASQAVEAGFDEIQHANFLFLQFVAGPNDDTRTPIRFTKVAEHGASLDLDGKDVQAFLDLLVAHHTVLDPTLATFEGMFTTEPTALPPNLAYFEGRLPGQTERGAHGGGLPATGNQRATYRASHAKMMELIKRAFDRGIRIVAGTDDIAVTLPRELELYVKAGISAPDVLALDTIGAARVMGLDREAGSVTAGKRADLVLVDGDPTRDISAVRKADTVVCRGIVYNPRELFEAVGIRSR